jgi:hypothetical protein
MNAIIPINVAAIRVSELDNNSIVDSFKGRTALFDQLPWGNTTSASTGDTIFQPLQSPATPAAPLGIGIHLQWELPDFFRNGIQRAGGDIVFPPAPNRWLVVRSLSLWDTNQNVYGPVTLKSFIIESDYIGAARWVDSYGMTHPSVPVPLPTVPPSQKAPFLYMGRSLNYEDWPPTNESASDFLPSYTGSDGQYLQLNSLGFVGPGFSSYYPECTTVFGFWDHFMDKAAVGPLIQGGSAVQFKVSYQVIGWIDPSIPDPLAGLGTQVTNGYNAFVKKCEEQGVPVPADQTPASWLESTVQQDFGWVIPGIDPKATIETLPMPSATLLNGIVQEVVWNQLVNPGTTSFLSTPTGQSIWQSTAEVAVGNTTVEALSALLSSDMGPPPNPDVLGGYEYLLNALQTGLLRELEAQPSKLIYLDESLHAKGFAAEFSGWEWVLDQPASVPNKAPRPSRQTDLPLSLAALLATLNAAQSVYDQARLALAMRRRQLYMDWFRYVKLQVNPSNPDPYVSLGTLEAFLQSGGPCELTVVEEAGTATGLLQFTYDPDSGNVVSMALAPGSGGLAETAATAYTALTTALASYKGWTLQAHAAPKFYLPTDPVLLVEGPSLVPAQRNGNATYLPVRLSSMLLTGLAVSGGSANFTVQASSIPGVPTVSQITPNAADVQALIAESFLLIPMLGPSVANNPAISNAAEFVTALNGAQGGMSPLEGGPGAGLFAFIRTSTYQAAANPSQTVSSQLWPTFTWTNATANGWISDPVGWNAQSLFKGLAPGRVDPFLPLYFIWTVRLAPLLWGNGKSYTANNLTQYFSLDGDAVDYTYTVPGGVPPTFVAPNTVDYSGAVILSSRAAYSLASQITAYLNQYPNDLAAAELASVREAYLARNFVSQALDGFSLGQTLSSVIPQIRVENLSKLGPRDNITTGINAAAIASSADDWYDQSFNNVEPVYGDPRAINNFGPLRAGFVEVRTLEVVDVFGQRMELTTAQMTTDGSLQPVVSLSLQPPPTDTVNAGKVFLPPRLLMPLRLWFRFLAAADLQESVAQSSGDVVGKARLSLMETNTHAASSPIFGWVVPNHLDQSLFFYDADGVAIGSFEVRAGALAYQTRPANLANPNSTLAEDLVGKNPHLATLMTFVSRQTGGFLNDLMNSIQNSDSLIQPSSSAQDLALAVLIGRPLALARCVLSLQTSGSLLPISQADTSSTDPFPSDVNNGRFVYETRQQFSSANVAGVDLPVRMGNLANVDDGLVCFLPEGSGNDPVYSIVYSATAPTAGANGVQQPIATTTQLMLNGSAAVMTLLMDPRASVHATTGVLPVSSVEIDPDQYQAALSNIAMTFFTAPVLSGSSSFVVPVPVESGYSWNWITAGASAPQPLKANAANGNATFGYSPQTLVEGWLDLVPTPPPTGGATRTAEEPSR